MTGYSGIYLVLQRNLVRFVFGLILLSGGVNLLIFTAGRVTRGAPPIVPPDAYAPPLGAANALPQALILTAIVIGFGLTAFAMVLGHAGCDVTVWSRDAKTVEQITTIHQNRTYHPGVELPPNVSATLSADQALSDAEFVVLALPSQVVAGPQAM